MKIRKSDKRVRVSVHGPMVSGTVTASAIERYVLGTGWIPVYSTEEPAETAPWWHLRPRRYWEVHWPEDMPIGYDREGAQLTLPSPYYRRVKLGAIVEMIGRVEGRAPSDVLADIACTAA